MVPGDPHLDSEAPLRFRGPGGVSAGWKRSHATCGGETVLFEAQHIGSSQSTVGGKGTLLRKLQPSPARWSPSWGTQMGWKQPCRGPINMSLQVTGVPLGFPPGCGVVGGHQNQLTAEGPGLGRLGQGGARKGRMERAEPRVLSPLRNRDPPYSPGSGQADALGRG